MHHHGNTILVIALREAQLYVIEHVGDRITMELIAKMEDLPHAKSVMFYTAVS